MKAPAPLDYFEFLLSPVYDGSLAPEHLDDLRRSGLSNATITLQKIRSVPPDLIDRLLGHQVPRAVTSAMLIPYWAVDGQPMPHIRVKIFPPITDGDDGHAVKYLQPRGSGLRLFFPLAAAPAVTTGTTPLFIVEGEKKSLAVAQRGIPTIGVAGIDCWHAKGSRALLPDFDAVALMGRTVEIVPDSDFQTNPSVRAAVSAFATALATRGARARVVLLPDEVAA